MSETYWITNKEGHRKKFNVSINDVCAAINLGNITKIEKELPSGQFVSFTPSEFISSVSSTS